MSEFKASNIMAEYKYSFIMRTQLERSKYFNMYAVIMYVIYVYIHLVYAHAQARYSYVQQSG